MYHNILCVPYSQVHWPDQWWLFLELLGLVDGSLMTWDQHVRLHHTQFLCRQLLYTVSTHMCNLFWTRSGRRLSYPVWWVFLNFNILLNCWSRSESIVELLITIWVYCLLRITISLVDEHIPHKLTIIQLEELNCRQCSEVDGGARISSERP